MTEPRILRQREQAAEVMRLQLPAGFVDPQSPDLAGVKQALLVIGDRMLKSARRGDVIAILDEKRLVRVWLTSDEQEVVAFAVEASYDGGRTFANPLSRYRDLSAMQK